MSKVHNLYEYERAKKVITDYPQIINILDKMQEMCYSFMEYNDIKDLHTAINETKTIFDIQKEYYQDIVDRKGAR